MVVISIEQYGKLIADIEVKLDEADEQAEATSARYAHNEGFDKLRGITDGKEPLQA